MDYPESMKYIFGLTHSGIKLGLDNSTRILDALGNPQDKVPTVHIAGTNGKGSTAAYVESILRAAGFRVGLYTSPHLLDFRERIQIDRQLISENDLAELATHVRHSAERLDIPISYFELSTAMALQHFFKSRVDCNVMEVGLGGRLDSTNLCHGRVCVITSIGYDHEKALGNSLASIAFEKASIIKHPCQVISGVNQPEAAQVVQKRAEQFSSPLCELEKDLKVHIRSHSLDGLEFDVKWGEHIYQNLRSGLLGRQQANNAALALAACLSLGSREFPIDESAIRQGIGMAQWPGRLDRVSHQPEIVFDCAHNLEGITQLMENLEELYPGRSKRFILGFMQDKRYSEMFEIVSRFAHHITLTRPKQDRGLNPTDWQRENATDTLSIDIMENISDALTEQIKSANKD